MSKNCLQCGYINDDKANFCVRCGTRLPAVGESANTDGRFGENGAAEASERNESPAFGQTIGGGETIGNVWGGADNFGTDGSVRDGNVESGNDGNVGTDDGSVRGEADNVGNGNKVSAEWQGSDCRCDFGGAGTCAPTPGNAYNQPSVTPNGTPCGPSYGPYGPYYGPAYGPAGAPPQGGYYGGNYNNYNYGNYGGAPAPGYSSEYYAEQRRQWAENARKTRVASKRKTLFVLAFVGLLLDFLCGIGALMCLPVAIISSVELSRFYREEKKMSTQLVWATIVGYIGALLGLLFLIFMIR